MKKPGYLLLVVSIILLVAVLSNIDESDAAPEPRKRGGGGSKKSSGSSGFGSLFGGSKKKNKGYSNSGGYGGSNYKKKSKTKSNLKKAAVIGATAYGAYQLGKLSNSFGGYNGGYGHGSRWGYRDYNNWREVDGMLCRNTQDCDWIDRRLYCQDYELKFQPSALWFGGNAAAIVGECACPHGMRWDNYEVQCKTNYFSGTNLVIAILVPLLVLVCCCCVGVYVVRKMFS